MSHSCRTIWRWDRAYCFRIRSTFILIVRQSSLSSSFCHSRGSSDLLIGDFCFLSSFPSGGHGFNVCSCWLDRNVRVLGNLLVLKKCVVVQILYEEGLRRVLLTCYSRIRILSWLRGFVGGKSYHRRRAMQRLPLFRCRS
jgi:hypothetical protein